MEENNEVLLISVDDACKILNMSENTLKKLMKASRNFPALITPRKDLDRQGSSTKLDQN